MARRKVAVLGNRSIPSEAVSLCEVILGDDLWQLSPRIFEDDAMCALAASLARGLSLSQRVILNASLVAGASASLVALSV